MIQRVVRIRRIEKFVRRSYGELGIQALTYLPAQRFADLVTLLGGDPRCRTSD